MRDIGQKGAKDEKKSAKEDQWLKQMEQQAMKDYRNKDLQDNSDLTAKIFNEKRGERDSESEKDVLQAKNRSNAEKAMTLDKNIGRVSDKHSQSSATKRPGPPSFGVPSKSILIEEGSISHPFQQRVSAKTQGTKYHNPPPETSWREAITEDGNIYYWHTTSHASVWEPPAEGFISIKQQEIIAEKQNTLNNSVEKKKKEIVERTRPAQSVKQTHTTGPTTKPDPYGSWQTVADKSQSQKKSEVDYQTPKVDLAPQANVVLHSDRSKKFEINSKKTPSLGGTDDENFQVDFSAGINSASKHKKSTFEQHGSKSPVPEPDKPAIVFRKRKVNIPILQNMYGSLLLLRKLCWSVIMILLSFLGESRP